MRSYLAQYLSEECRDKVFVPVGYYSQIEKNIITILKKLMVPNYFILKTKQTNEQQLRFFSIFSAEILEKF